MSRIRRHRKKLLLAVAVIALLVPNVIAYLHARSVRVPTLLLHGDSDPTIPLERARGIFEALAAERKT